MQKLPYFVRCNVLDLDQLYEDLDNEGFELKKLWPNSEYTEYWLSEDQVEIVRSKPYVEECELPIELQANEIVSYYSLYNQDPTVRNLRSVFGYGADPQARDWKWPAVWGDQQERKLGYFPAGEPFDQELTIHGDGDNVDIFMWDQQISIGNPEFDDNGVNRIIQYDWEYNYNVNNGIPNTRAEDGTLGSWYRYDVPSTGDSHGVQSASTIGGRYHGFANKAKFYEFPRGLGLIQCTIYAVDWHKHKKKNPVTGWPNRTINAAQQGRVGRWEKLAPSGLTRMHDWQPGGVATNVDSIEWIDGQTYSASNPNPTGWNDLGVDIDFGVNDLRYSSWKMNQRVVPSRGVGIPCIQSGITVTLSAGNTSEWLVPRGHINPPFVNFSAANGNGRQAISLEVVTNAVNDDIDAHLPVVQSNGSHERPGRISGKLTTGSAPIITGSTISPGLRSGFSCWGGVTWFAPGSKLIAAANIDHVNGNAWVSLRHGTPMYNCEYSGTSASNPCGTGFLACLMSGTKPGPRLTNADAHRIIDRCSENQDLDVSNPPEGVNDQLEMLFMLPQQNVLYAVSNYPVTGFYSPGHNLQTIYGGHSLSITTNLADWQNFRYELIDIAGNNQAYRFWDYNTLDPNSIYPPYAVVDNPTIEIFDGTMLFLAPIYPHLTVHHPFEVRFNPDDPNTVVPWSDTGGTGYLIYLAPPIGFSGTVWYVCKNHPSQMRGRINVTACNWTESWSLSNSNTTGGTDLVQGVKYYLIDPNNRLQPNYSTAVYPGDPGFRGLKYPGEFLSYDVPGYGTLTIGDKYYLQSEQVLRNMCHSK